MKTTSKIIFILFSCLLMASCLQKEDKKSQNIIVVDTDFTLQNGYYGGAMQWEPNDRDAMTEAQWERLLSRVEFMQLGYIRCCVMPYFYCFGFNENNPKLIWETDPATINTEWYANSHRYMNDLYRLLKFCQEQDIDVMLGEWWRPNDIDWRQVVPVNLQKYSLELDDLRYTKQVTALVNHLVKDKGFTCIKQFNLGNEVNLLAHSPDSGYTWKKWKKSIQNLYASFQDNGLEHIKIVGPDGGYWGEDVWFNKTIEQLDKEVCVIDYHWYIDKDWTLTNRVEDETRMFRFFTQLNNKEKTNIWGEMGIRDGHDETFDQHTQLKTVWYGTFIADALIQTLRSGWSAGAAWGMDDAMHYKDDSDKQKIWGFWNSIAEQKGKPEEAEIRPWFYTWSLMSRNFPKGSDILYSNSYRTQHLNCVAMKTLEGDLSFVITNTADFAHDVTLQIPNVINNPTFCKYVFFENDRPVDENGFPVVKEYIKGADLKSGITINFPEQGFIMLTTIGGSKPKIIRNEKTMIDPMIGLQRFYDYSKNLGMNGFAKFYDRCGSNTPEFQFSQLKHDVSTIHPSTNNESAYITYYFPKLNNFNIQVSGKETIDGRFKIYASTDNKDWDEIHFESTIPELGIWRWFHASLTPKDKLNEYNYLKIEMNPKGYFSNSRIREVQIFAN